MLYFVTKNKNKVDALQKHLTQPVVTVEADIEEIQSLDPVHVVTLKAKSAYDQLKKPVIVEDTSLIFHSLGRLPGTLIKWFLEELKCEGLCRLLDLYHDRSATAAVYFAYYDGIKIEIFSAHTDGVISEHPRGTAGFGWDPIFIPRGQNKTWGEDHNSSISLREKAAIRLEQFLLKLEK